MRWLGCVFAAALAAFTAAPAWAQSDEASPSSESLRWLVVPARGGASETADEGVSVEGLHTSAEALRQELVVRGHSVWRADRASERFEVVGSAPAPQISQSDIDLWVERSRAAVRYLARADYKAARRELKAAQRLADRAAAELNREAARAQQVLDTCLFMVRAYVETKNGAEARRQARECQAVGAEGRAQRVSSHARGSRSSRQRWTRRWRRRRPGTLEVQSTPSDCLVRINGVEFGRTPLSGIELPVGAYRTSGRMPGGASRAHPPGQHRKRGERVRVRRGARARGAHSSGASLRVRRGGGVGAADGSRPARWHAFSGARTCWW